MLRFSLAQLVTGCAIVPCAFATVWRHSDIKTALLVIFSGLAAVALCNSQAIQDRVLALFVCLLVSLGAQLVFVCPPGVDPAFDALPAAVFCGSLTISLTLVIPWIREGTPASHKSYKTH